MIGVSLMFSHKGLPVKGQFTLDLTGLSGQQTLEDTLALMTTLPGTGQHVIARWHPAGSSGGHVSNPTEMPPQGSTNCQSRLRLPSNSPQHWTHMTHPNLTLVALLASTTHHTLAS